MHGTILTPARTLSLLLVLLALSGGPDRALAGSAYGIQVGSYQDLDNAVDRVNYLKRLGYGAFYRYETVQGKGKWYRVYIARFSTLDKAREEARVLRDLELIEAYDIRRLRNGASSSVSPPAAKKARPAGPPAEAPAPAPSGSPEDTVYLLHVSSFKEREHAVEEARKLEKAGQRAFYVEEDLASGHWFRVYIGKYESEKAARAAGERLEKEGLISYFKPLKIDRAGLSGKE